MSENVKARSRGGSRRTATPAPVVDVPATDAPATDAPATDAPPTDAPVAESTLDAPEVVDTTAEVPAEVQGTADEVGDQEAVTVADVAPVGDPEGVVGWADAVPWLALRWGTAPTAAELRFGSVVWRMLQEHTRPGYAGRTVLQMAAAAEVAGNTELDPVVLSRVLARYHRAGIARAVTHGVLTWWSAVDPTDIVTEARESVRETARPVGPSAARTGRVGVSTRVRDGVATPAGALRGLVEDHLSENPFEDFSPSQVAKALGRSSGAVANALERLTEHGTAIQTSAAPRRYQHRPDPDATAAPVAAGADTTADETDTTDAAE